MWKRWNSVQAARSPRQVQYRKFTKRTAGLQPSKCTISGKNGSNSSRSDGLAGGRVLEPDSSSLYFCLTHHSDSLRIFSRYVSNSAAELHLLQTSRILSCTSSSGVISAASRTRLSKCGSRRTRLDDLRHFEPIGSSNAATARCSARSLALERSEQSAVLARVPDSDTSCATAAKSAPSTTSLHAPLPPASRASSLSVALGRQQDDFTQRDLGRPAGTCPCFSRRNASISPSLTETRLRTSNRITSSGATSRRVSSCERSSMAHALLLEQLVRVPRRS